MIIFCYMIDERAVYCIPYIQKRGMNGGGKCEINVSDVLFSPFPEKKNPLDCRLCQCQPNWPTQTYALP